MQMGIWKRFTHSLVSCSLVLAQDSFAHIPQRRPVSEIPAVAGVSERNRAGYGWLNSSSESEADSVFQTPCPAPGANTAPPCVNRYSPLANYLNAADHNLEVAATEMVKEKAFEYLALQMSAMGEKVTSPPSCLADNESANKVVRAVKTLGRLSDEQLDSHITRTDDIMAQESRRDPRKFAQARGARNLSVKLRAVRASSDIDRVSQAYMLEKQLKVHEDRICPKHDDDSKLRCMSIRKNRHRISQAFPVIFGNGGIMSEVTLGGRVRPEGNLVTENNDSCGRNAYARFRQGLFNILGADTNASVSGLPDTCDATTTEVQPASAACPVTRDTRRLVCRGQKLFRASVDDEGGYPELVSPGDIDEDGNIIDDGRWNRAFRSMEDPDVVDPQKARLAAAKNDWTAAFGDLKTNYKEVLAAQMVGLCRDNTSLRSLATRYPNVVQQAVLDLEDQSSRDAMRMVMCQQNIMQKFQLFSQSLVPRC